MKDDFRVLYEGALNKLKTMLALDLRSSFLTPPASGQ